LRTKSAGIEQPFFRDACRAALAAADKEIAALRGTLAARVATAEALRARLRNPAPFLLAPEPAPKKRHVSAALRKQQSERMRARWAKVKAATLKR
jgi:hypothetical protein